MSNKNFKGNIETIDLLIKEKLEELKTTATGKEKIRFELKELIEFRKELQGSESIRDNTKLNINTIASIGGSLATTLLILNFEKADVITSKAFSLGTKLLGR